MAVLSAEDVLNKAFSKTKYREGFDQDEVDDFLDEVAHTIQQLTAERDELAQRLAAAEAGQPAPAPAPAEAAPATEAGGVPGSSSLLQAATDPNPPSATGMLAMAQKLHDEYVQAGEEEKERILDEAKSKAEKIVEQAEGDARTRMAELESERSDLERRIDDLRRFERDYRGRLKSYLENLLGDLDHGAGKDRAPAGGAGLGGPESGGTASIGGPDTGDTPSVPPLGSRRDVAAANEASDAGAAATDWPSFGAGESGQDDQQRGL